MVVAGIALFLIGWPAFLAGLCLIAWGVKEHAPRAALAGALLTTPALLYLSMTPRFEMVRRRHFSRTTQSG